VKFKALFSIINFIMMSIRRILFKDETSVTPTLLNFIVMEWKRLQIFATQKLYFIFYFIFLTCSSKITGGWKRFSFTLIFKLIVNSITARNQISPYIHQINKFLVSWGKFQSGISEVCSKSLGKLGKLIKLCIKKDLNMHIQSKTLKAISNF
jgi:hypothetical protein